MVGFKLFNRKPKKTETCRQCKQRKTKNEMCNLWICCKCWHRSIRYNSYSHEPRMKVFEDKERAYLKKFGLSKGRFVFFKRKQ